MFVQLPTSFKFWVFAFCMFHTLVINAQNTNALHFDGVDDEIVTASYMGTDYIGDLTIEAWVKPESLNGGTIVSRHLLIGEFNLTFRNDSLNYYHGNSLETINVRFSYAFTSNTWYHIAVVRNILARTVTLYVNGVHADTKSWNGTLDNPDPAAQNLVLRIGSSDTTKFHGTIDELRIWNVQRTQTQIQNNMNCDVAQSANLLAYYRLDEGIAGGTNNDVTSVNDFSFNYRCATLNNFSLSGSTSNWVTGNIPGCNVIHGLREVEVRGNNVTVRDGETSPSGTNHTAFGSVALDSTFTRTFTIYNPGIANLNIGSITKSGTHQGDFTVSGIVLPAVIPGGDSATFTVTFAPGGTGIRSATIIVNSDDCDEATYNFAINGMGGVNTWTGTASSDWHDDDNWSSGVAPTSVSPVSIASGTPNAPIVPSGDIDVVDINIASGSTVTLNGGTVLRTPGSFTNNGTVTGAGKLVLNGSSIQTISGVGTVSNLELDNANGATIENTVNDTLKLTGLLTLTSGTLTTNDKLVLKSTASDHAAMVGPIPSSGAGISGNVIHERYLSAPGNGSGGRAWRLLTSPLANHITSNSIFYHWQNNGINDGTGIELFSPTGNATNGLTQGGNSTSIRSYDAPTNTYQNITNTKTTNLFTGTRNNTFLVFVSGHYGSGNITGGSGITNLDASGTLVTGTQTYSFTPPNSSNIYYLMGNPYACPIDFDKVYNNAGTQNIERMFWVINPTLSNIGAYETVLYSEGNYISSTGIQNQFIQTGQGFFVEGTTPNTQSTVVIEEDDKETSAAQTPMFRTNGSNLETFRIKLYKTINNNPVLLDGTVVVGHQNSNNGIDGEDGKKFGNFNENISIWKGNNTWLAIESRTLLDHNDTVSIAISNMQQTTYQFVFEPGNMTASGLNAVLIDNFTNTTTPISLTANSAYTFTVNSTTTSQGTDRFKIVFQNTTPLAVAFINISAEKEDNGVKVQWNVSEQKGIHTYEVERSNDGRSFVKIASLPAADEQGYNYMDEQPFDGDNYYRIKAVARSTSGVYSNIVRVKLQQTRAMLNSYPNPAGGNQLQIGLSNLAKGNYHLSVYNIAGQKVAAKDLSYEGGSAVISMNIENLTPGNYVLQLVNEQGESVAEQKMVRQ